MTTPPEPAFLTVQEYADLLRVSKWSVYDAVNAGQIKAVRVGKSVRIPRSQLDHLAAGQ